MMSDVIELSLDDVENDESDIIIKNGKKYRHICNGSACYLEEVKE